MDIMYLNLNKNEIHFLNWTNWKLDKLEKLDKLDKHFRVIYGFMQEIIWSWRVYRTIKLILISEYIGESNQNICRSNATVIG